jgi:hydrogenase maturation factor
MSANVPVCTCITCSDQAIEMVVTGPGTGDGLARCVDGEGATSEVEVTLVGPVEAGTHLFVHAGTAIALAPVPAS